MSDYLTNLVIRSFAPVVTVRPLGVGLSAPPEGFQAPSAAFSDPFAEPAVLGDDVPAESDKVTPQRKRLPHKVTVPQAPIGTEREAVEASLDNIQPVTTASPSSELPVRAESVPSRSPPRRNLLDRTSARPDEPPRIAAGRALPTSEESEKSPPEPSMSARKTPDPGKRTVKPGLRTPPRKRLEEISSVPPEIPGFDGAEPKRNVVRSTRVARVADVKPDTPNLPPIDPGHSTWQLVKSRANGVSLSPQTSATHLQRAISAAPDRLQAPSVVESAVAARTTKQIEEKQPPTAPLTTLIPNTGAQPLLPLNVKTPSNLPHGATPDQSDAQVPLTETIINVAIGRIEVRATPFETARRERQSKGPKVMNLDDYTQQRSRGSR